MKHKNKYCKTCYLGGFNIGKEQGRKETLEEVRKIFENMNNYTTYDLMYNGFSISPTLSRDAYLQECWIKFSDIDKIAQEME